MFNFLLKMFNFLFGKYGKINIAYQGLNVIYGDTTLRIMYYVIICIIYVFSKYEPDNIYRTVLIIPMLLLFIIETINYLFEITVDRISLKKHPLSKKIKDVSTSITFVFSLFIIYLYADWIYREWVDYKLYYENINSSDIILKTEGKENNDKNIFVNFNKNIYDIFVVFLCTIFITFFVRYIINKYLY